MVYTDRIEEKDTVRTFNQEVDANELVWHRDREDREILALHETDWMLQLDNELPVSLNERIKIEAGVWHRLIKGTGDLTIKIKKGDEKN